MKRFKSKRPMSTMLRLVSLIVLCYTIVFLTVWLKDTNGNGYYDFTDAYITINVKLTKSDFYHIFYPLVIASFIWYFMGSWYPVGQTAANDTTVPSGTDTATGTSISL